MFYLILKNLCLSRNLKLTNVLKELSISLGNTTRWKNGTLPNGAILIKFADYFGCSVDYLLGRTDTPQVINFPDRGAFMYNSQETVNRIKFQAKKQNISINQLLSNCGLGRNTITKMSKGMDILTHNFLKIANYLDCSVDYLLGKTDNPMVNK